MSESFQTPTSIFPLSRNPIRPNIFFSSMFRLVAKASRMPPARDSSKAIRQILLDCQKIRPINQPTATKKRNSPDDNLFVFGSHAAPFKEAAANGPYGRSPSKKKRNSDDFQQEFRR